MSNARGSSSRPAAARHAPLDLYGESLINMALIDRRRFGWSAAGGVVSDLLPPHERARSKSSKNAFLRKRKRNNYIQNSQQMISDGNEALSMTTKSASTLSTTARQVPAISIASGSMNGIHTDRAIGATAQQPLRVQYDEISGVDSRSDLTVAAVDVINRKKLPNSIVEYPTTPIPLETIHPSHIGETDGDCGGGGRWYHDCTTEELRRLEPLHFRAIAQDGTLDIYTYRRGREECEIRDEATGELLCDVASAADSTTYGSGTDPPKTTVSLTIQFPLEDEPSTNHFGRTRYFREAVEWDLANPHGPTPMKYATDIAVEFGLSYTQTLDLAESIQNQIRQFVNDHVSVGPALALTTRRTSSASDRASRLVPTLYGETTGHSSGGFLYTAQHKNKSSCARQSRSVKSSRTNSVGKKPTAGDATVGNDSTSTRTGKRPAKSKRRNSYASDLEKPDERYRDEVQRRLHEASTIDVQAKLRQTGMLNNSSDGLKLAVQDDILCHRCRAVGRSVVFACGLVTHAYCIKDMRELCGQLGDTEESPDSWFFEYCPICALRCDCRDRCQSKLDMVAIAFKEKNVAQRVDISETIFKNLFSFSQSVQRRPLAGKDTTKQKAIVRKRFDLERIIVAKVPESEFPREMFMGKDLDPCTALDYATLYTNKGSIVQSEFLHQQLGSTSTANLNEGEVVVWSESAASAYEDGSVDYCNMCGGVGDLLCCDYCPRAFHSACLGDDVASKVQSNVRWECPSCSREKDDCLLEYQIDGEKSLAAICVAYDDIHRPLSDENLQALKTLSVIHEMLLSLLEYDFGYIFREPVDCIEIPTYRSIIAEPMDLGTIASCLIGGAYRNKYCIQGAVLEDVILAVLKDIELVWYNCFLFNCEGSAVYRMAETLKRRAAYIRRRSLDSLLSNRIKSQLDEYIQSREASRPSRSRGTSLGKHEAPYPRKQTKHEINAVGLGAHGRPVAVFDPDTGRVVKAYSTMMSVVSVLKMLFKHKFACEWELVEVDTIGKLRGMVVKSTTDPSILVFGYRWLHLDDLKQGRVVFPKRDETAGSTLRKQLDQNTELLPNTSHRIVQVNEGSRCYIFGSFGKALSYFNANASELTLHANEAQTMGFDRFAHDGREWRFLDLTDRTTASSPSRIDISKIPGVVVVKEDRTTKKKLMAFKSLDAAFGDWNQTLADNNVVRSMEVFQSMYLNGGRDVNGILWIRTDAVVQHQATTDNLSLAQYPDPLSIANGVLVHKGTSNSTGLEYSSITATISTGKFASFDESMALGNGVSSQLISERQNGKHR